MMKFIENFEKMLPYEREHYIDFLDDDFDSETKWNAISLQMNSENEENNLSKFVDVFELILKNVILKLDSGISWIINHDDKDMKWFLNDKNNLEALRSVFKQNNIQDTYKGSLILDKDDLFELAQDLISYPYVLSYKNLDISHSKLPFILKITSHLTIDLLCMDKELLRKVIDENSSNKIIIKEYRGTSLFI
jgi:hypothetical protein